MSERYYCIHGSYSEYDRQRCKPCKERAKVRSLGDLRACGDCLQYVPIKVMVTKADGRVICPGCQKAIEARAREKAQADLFTSQPGLFEGVSQ